MNGLRKLYARKSAEQTCRGVDKFGDRATFIKVVHDFDAESTNMGSANRFLEFIKACGIELLISVYPERPLTRSKRESVISGGREVFDPIEVAFNRPEAAGNLHCAICGACVNDNNLVNDALERCQALLKDSFLIFDNKASADPGSDSGLRSIGMFF